MVQVAGELLDTQMLGFSLGNQCRYTGTLLHIDKVSKLQPAVNIDVNIDEYCVEGQYGICGHGLMSILIDS